MASKFGVGNATFRVGGKPGFVDTVAFGMYRKEIHDIINGFDEELVRNQDDEYNYKLSDDRARSVKNYLVNQEVSSERLKAFGEGENRPIANNNTAFGREQNRRVELYIVAKQ